MISHIITNHDTTRQLSIQVFFFFLRNHSKQNTTGGIYYRKNISFNPEKIEQVYEKRQQN